MTRKTKNKRSHMKLSKSIIIRAVICSSIIMWIIALYLPAYIHIDYPDRIISGAGAFIFGLYFSVPMLFGRTFLALAWMANIGYIIAIITLMGGKFKNSKLPIYSILLATAPLGAYFPGDIMFENENDISQATIGIAAFLWHGAIALVALCLFTMSVKQTKMPFYSDGNQNNGMVLID